MEIWHITENDPFIAGTGDFKAIENRFIKLNNASIFFCRQGHAHIQIDLLEYDLIPNAQLVLLPGSIIHITEVSDDFKISFIVCSPTLFQEISNRLEPPFFRFLKEAPCVVLPAGRERSVDRLAETIEELYNDRENCFRLQIAKNYIQSFLLEIYDKTHRLFMQKRPEGVSRQEELFKRFIQLVHKHCTSQREVSFYANELFITARYLSTVIQNVTGLTAKSIIDKHVVLEIKTLLKSTDLSIQEISNQLCFPDQSFFGRYFKKHTGVSPLKYRNTP